VDAPNGEDGRSEAIEGEAAAGENSRGERIGRREVVRRERVGVKEEEEVEDVS